MISYKPFYQTLLRKGITEYYLIYKQGMDSNTIHRMKHGKAITTTTLNTLCEILNCRVEDILEYVPDEDERHSVLFFKQDRANGAVCRAEAPGPQRCLFVRTTLAPENQCGIFILSYSFPKKYIIYGLYFNTTTAWTQETYLSIFGKNPCKAGQLSPSGFPPRMHLCALRGRSRRHSQSGLPALGKLASEPFQNQLRRTSNPF